MRDIVLRKRATDRDQLCTTFFVPEPNYKFTLEGCNETAEAIIRNAKGDVVAILKPNESVEIARRGNYLICIEGRNSLGTVWVEWVVPPATDNKEYCCDELRATNEVIRTEVNNIKEIVNNLSLGTTTVSAGENVTVVKNGNDYKVSAKDTIPDVDKAYVDSKIASIQDKDTVTTVSGGTNITVMKSGDNYEVSAPDVTTKDYVDNKIAAIVDKDTVTTVSGGANVTVTKSGDNYEVSAPDVTTKDYVDNKIASIQDKDTVTTVSGGTNVSVTKSGDNYEVSAPDVATKDYVDQQITNIVDHDTVTTVSAGDNVTVTKSGNDYKISAKDTVITLSQGKNVTIITNGIDYEISAIDTVPDVDKQYVDRKIAEIVDKDTVTTVSAGSNITITKSGDDYQVSAPDMATKSYVDDKISQIQDDDTIITVSSGDSNTTVTKTNNDYKVAHSLEPTYNNAYSTGVFQANIINADFEAKNIQSPYAVIIDKKVKLPGEESYVGSYLDSENLSFYDEENTSNYIARYGDKGLILAKDNHEVRLSNSGYLTGLKNLTFDPANIASGRAATEDQLLALKNILDASDDDTVITVSAGDNVTVTKTGNDYKISATGSGTTNPITVSAGNNIVVSKSGDDYKVSAKIELLDDFTIRRSMGFLTPGMVINKGTTIEKFLRMAFEEEYIQLEYIHRKEGNNFNSLPYFDTGIPFKPLQKINFVGGIEPGKMGAPITAVESSSMRGGMHFYSESSKIQMYWANKSQVEQVNFLDAPLNIYIEADEGTLVGNTNVVIRYQHAPGTLYSSTISYDPQYFDTVSSATWKVFYYPLNTDIRYGFIYKFTIKEFDLTYNFTFYRRTSDGVIVMKREKLIGNNLIDPVPVESIYIEPIGDASLLEEYNPQS